MKKAHKIIISIVIIIVVMVISFFLLNKKEKEEAGPLRVKVAGVIRDLLNTPVSGVDLVVGDTSIRTGETGRFIFTDVSVETGIRLTHPELLRAIAKLPAYAKASSLLRQSADSADKSAGKPETLEDAQTTNILFDVPLLNSLITIIDVEARGGGARVYEYLDQEIQKFIPFEKFNSEYKQIFREEDITNQEITIKRVRRESNYYARDFELRFEEMVEFEVVNSSNVKWYRLVLSDSEEIPRWRLIP